jgi:hypothetical protein
MKKCSNPLLIVCLTLLALIQSCSKNEVTPTNQKRYGGTVSFTANGQVYNLSTNSIYVYSGILELSSLLNKNDQTSTFGLTLRSGIGVTTYDLANKSDVWAGYWDGANGYYGPGATPTGQVIITKIDETNKTMSGTFSATLESTSPTATVAVSNGVFTDVPYVIEDDGSGALKIATVDGTAFTGRLYSQSASPSFTFVSSNKSLSFSLPNNITAGNTYNAIDLVAPNYFIKYVDGLYSYRPKGGTYTITKYTSGTEIQGTFEVQMESYPVGGKLKSITSGTFAVTF